MRQRWRNSHTGKQMLKLEAFTRNLWPPLEANLRLPKCTFSFPRDNIGRKSPRKQILPAFPSARHNLTPRPLSLLIVTELDRLQPGVEQVRVRQHRPGAHPPQEAVGAGPAHVQQVGRPLPPGATRRRVGGRPLLLALHFIMHSLWCWNDKPRV